MKLQHINSHNKENILKLFILIIAFILPFEKIIIRYSLVLFALFCLFIADYKQLKYRKNWIKLSLISLWILPFLQLLILNKLGIYWEHLMTKLTLFIIPIIIITCYKPYEIKIGKVLKFFTLGCLISALFCMLNSLFSYYFLENIRAFNYTSLSIFHHPGYFTMYLNFVIGITYLALLKPIEFFNISIKWSIIIISFLTLFILIASSRTGWITNIFLHIIFLTIIITNKKFSKKIFFYLIIFLIPLVSIIYINPTIKLRFNELVKSTINVENSKKVSSSSNVRRKTWLTSTKLIKKKWLFGYGTGIGKKALKEQNKKDGYDYMVKKNFNAHNQFLQVLIDHGLIGFLILSFYSFFMIYSSIVKKKFIYTIFLSIVILNFLTESILETQSGVIFFAFFNTILFFDWFNFKTLKN